MNLYSMNLYSIYNIFLEYILETEYSIYSIYIVLCTTQAACTKTMEEIWI